MFRLIVSTCLIIAFILLTLPNEHAHASVQNTQTAPFESQSSSSSSSSQSDGDVRYIILIDAGSTGSRIHVHEYTFSSVSGLPDIQPSKNKKLKPGLSSYAASPQHAAVSITDLLSFAKEIVPAHLIPSTPIHLQATAGLRSISSADAQLILEIVRDTLASSGFYFHRSYANIISGDQEGINGWLAANYLAGVFDINNNNEDDDNIDVTKTTGVVEMGGTSLQITYVPSKSVLSKLASSSQSPSNPSHLTSLTIAGHTYTVYTHSYLHYGLQAAEKLYQKMNFDEIEESGNPCFNKGYRHSATGNFHECIKLVNKIMDKQAHCSHSSCSFNSVFQPTIHEERAAFIAIENFFYTLQFFGVSDKAGVVAPSSPSNVVLPLLDKSGSSFCSSEWSALKEKHPDVNVKELGGYCFAAAYETSILTHGLGFTKDNNMRAVREIKGKPIDWALGAVLGEILKLSSSATGNVHKQASSLSESDIVDTGYASTFPLAWRVAAFILVTATVAFGVRKYKQRQTRTAPSKYANAFSRV